jgi:hypothetical protein
VAQIPEGEEGGAPDMSLVHRRVHELVRVLSKFKELRDPALSRQVCELSFGERYTASRLRSRVRSP